jgi:DNA-binding transcriptional LysR family regulator
MNFRHLEYLRLAVEHGSFAEAAKRAGVSQAAVTLAMQTLEAELGFTLFQRQGRRKQPTDRAIAVAHASIDITMAIDRLAGIRPAREAKRDTNVLRVGLAPAAALLYSPLIYRRLRECAPGQALRIVSESAPAMLEQLQKQTLDLVIAPQPRKFLLGDLERARMYVGNAVIYARVGHPLAGASTLAQIVDAEWVVTGVARTPGNLIEEAFRVRGWAPPKIAVQCTDYGLLLRMVASSDLLGVISNVALIEDSKRLGVRSLNIREGLPRYDVCLFWSKAAVQNGSRNFTPVIEALLESNQS